MRKIAGLLIVLCGCVLSISAQKELSNSGEVSPVINNLNIDGTQIVYALPKNIARVEITIRKTQTTEGPYAKYAAKFLNITEGVVSANSVYYSIVDASISRYSVVDSSKYFTIGKINPFNIPELKMNADGVILSCNSISEVAGYEAKLLPELFIEKEFDEELFLDLGTKSFLIEKTETHNKTVKTDTGDVQIPYVQKNMAPKSEEQNAEEAASFIRKLRKRKLKLLVAYTGEVNEVDGVAMKVMINELKELENSYLELFVGREQSIEQKYYFDYEPEADVVQEQAILCYFSSKNGLIANKSEARRGDFEPVILSTNTVGSVPKPELKMMDNSNKTPITIRYGLYYRIPGRVKFTLKIKSGVLAQQQMQIAQKGQVVPLPSEYLVDRKFAIDFYSETGALKSIKHNKD